MEIRRGWNELDQEKVLRYLIDSADSLELTRMTEMIVRRYAELFEKEEVVFLSLPKHDTEECRRIICGVLEMDQYSVKK